MLYRELERAVPVEEPDPHLDRAVEQLRLDQDGLRLVRLPPEQRQLGIPIRAQATAKIMHPNRSGIVVQDTKNRIESENASENHA